MVTGLIFSLQFQPIQSYFGKVAANFLSRELQADITVGSLYFEPFSTLRITELYISDQQGDTLLHAPQMSADLDLTRFLQGQMTIHDISLSNALFRLHIDKEKKNNLSFLIEYFRLEHPDPERKRKITLELNRATLEQVSFIYVNENREQQNSAPAIIDFKDVHTTQISGEFSDIDFDKHLASARIKDFSLIEKSGFEIRKLNTFAVIDPHQIELRELDLQTNRSTVRDYLLLSFDDYSDFNTFIDSVDIRLELSNTRIASSDISFFTPATQDILFDVGISGSLSGRVNAIKGRNIDLQASSDTRLQGELSIRGLPDIEQTLFDFNLAYLSTTRREIEQLVTELGGPDRQINLPDFLGRTGLLRYNGNFKGHYNNFSATGSVQTSLGQLNTDILINFQDEIPEYSGNLTSPDFDLGQFLQLDRFGQIGFSAQVNGKHFDPQKMIIEWDGHIRQLDFNHYRYQQIETSGVYENNSLDGKLTVSDSNLRMETNGRISLSPDERSYQLNADISLADLEALNFYPDDRILISHASIHAHLHGHTVNDLQGQLSIDDLQINNDTDRFHIHTASITADGLNTARQVNLESDLGNASLSGQIDLYALWPYYKSIAAYFIPSLDLPAQDTGDQLFDFHLEINDFSPISALFAPELSIAPGSTFYGKFASSINKQSDQEFSNAQLYLPTAAWKSVAADELRLHLRADSTGLTTDLQTGRIRLNERQPFDSLHFTQKLQKNHADYRIHLSDRTYLHDANFSGSVDFFPERKVNIHSEPSDIVLNGVAWQVSEATVALHNGKTTVHGLGFSNLDQLIQIDGVASKSPDDQLHLLFDHFDFASIMPFILQVNYDFSGKINGTADINAIFGKPYATANLSIDQVALDRVLIGDLDLNADFDQDKSLVNLTVALLNNGHNTLSIGGRYHIDRPEENLDLHAKLDRLEVRVLQAILKDLIKDVSGTLSGTTHITGSLRNTIFNGKGHLDQVSFNVRYLNTSYRIDGPLRIQDTKLLFEDLMLADQRDQQAIINGNIDMRRPVNPLIGITIDATNLMVLNTTLRDNPLYFGTAYGTGRVAFQGRPDAMNITINARTEENTVFNIPLNTSTILGDNEFIRFTSFTPQDIEEPDVESGAGLLSGLNMNMDLHVTPGTIANIHTDLGELSGRGEGQINLRISSLGDFEMFGDYQVNSGKFTFTAQDFINKIFEIKQGGNIRWTGKPTDASIALTAFYEQRTSLSPLYDAAGRTPNEQRVLTRAEMELSGNLLRPTINFGLDFPADPYVQDELQSYLSDANNVNQQALSLIVRRSFLPGSSSDFSRELNTTLLSAGTELAFNQLNNIISQSLNLNFIDLNIRSLNDASASLRFFNDRLIFTGGITDLRNQRLSDLNVFSDRVATDTELLYLIRKDGRLVLRGSNRLNTRHFLLNASDEYISALGLIYRQEFDSFSEFFRRMILISRKPRTQSR